MTVILGDVIEISNKCIGWDFLDAFNCCNFILKAWKYRVIRKLSESYQKVIGENISPGESNNVDLTEWKYE